MADQQQASTQRRDFEGDPTAESLAIGLFIALGIFAIFGVLPDSFLTGVFTFRSASAALWPQVGLFIVGGVAIGLLLKVLWMFDKAKEEANRRQDALIAKLNALENKVNALSAAQSSTNPPQAASAAATRTP